MKISRRSMSALSIMILILVMCGGCMSQEKNKVTKDSEKVKDQVTKASEEDKVAAGPEEIKDKIISFLEKKYGKEFQPISLSDNEWPNYQDKLWVYPKGGDKEKDKFFAIGKSEDGEYEIGDTYVCQLIRGEYEERVREIAKDFFPQCRVDVVLTATIFPDEFTSNSTLQDVINAGAEYNPTVHIKVAPTFENIEQFDKTVDLFAKKMAESKLQGSPIIYYLWGNDVNLDNMAMDKSTFQKRRAFAIKQDFSIKNY